MNVDVLQEWFDLALAMAAVAAVLMAVLRWGNKRLEAKIVAELREATSEVRRDANGGQSLNDLHKKVDGLAADVALLKSAVIQLEDDVEGLMD